MEFPKEIKLLIKKTGFKPQKRLGQNFLIDKKILKTIIDSAELSIDDTVVEIGPGLGVLTKELVKKVNKVIAIEKDPKLAELLKDYFKKVKNLKIINEDALKYLELSLPKQFKIVANLPFYLATNLIKKFLQDKRISLIILTVQKEVGERICGIGKSRGFFSIFVEFYGEPELIKIFSKKSFWPMPKVDAAIVKIKPRSILPLKDPEPFFKFVKAGFSSRRKTLLNNLSENLMIEKDNLKKIFDKLDIDFKTRAQEMTFKNWLGLFNYLRKYKFLT